MGCRDWGQRTGVTIGNEAVFTKEPYATSGLTGMDLLRLGLERSRSADEAVETIIGLLEANGQGGGCGYEERSFTYHNRFIVADPGHAVVLETAGDKWATEHVASGVRTISNGLTIPGSADEYRDKLRNRVSACDTRTALTAKAAQSAVGPSDLMALLRSHGANRWPRYRLVNGTLSMPCMHGGGLVASSSSTAGWVSDLSADRHWITGTSAQCLGLFKPARVDEPVAIGAIPTGQDDGTSLWWRHERMARQVMGDPARLAPLFLPERDDLERSWLTDPPPGAEAFATGYARLERWAEKVAVLSDHDTRPWWVRRYWGKRAAAMTS